MIYAPSAPTAIHPSSLPTALVRAIYVHVPFCFHKCHYCDFYSITRQPARRMEQFVDLVLREAALWPQAGYGIATVGPHVCPRTVFIGGGTPSLLPMEAMRRLISGLHQRFDMADLAEFTMEANPATVTADYCAMLRDMGVNRLSFGAQSFNTTELATLQRYHRPEDIARTLSLARAAGFHRLNLDLIYAIPGQDLSSWLASLQMAISLGVNHLSCYGLTYEANTPISVRKQLGQISTVDEAVELKMLHGTCRCLAKAGFVPYEISNYCLHGEECRHNLLYWNGGDYIGLGPAAASHIRGTRWRNPPNLDQWEQAIARDTLPAMDIEHLSPLRRAGELIMLQLRLRDGINYVDFAARTGYQARKLYAGVIDQLAELRLVAADDRGFRLTERGIDISDTIAGQFLQPSDV